jgi:predicted nucleic acid-binding protein
MKIIIDSSIIIDYLRGGTKWHSFLKEAPRNAELFLPTIVIFELFSGQSSKNSTARKDILHLLQQFTFIELTETIAITAGDLYRQFGKHIGVSDYIIAASALELNASIVTLNKKHFEQITNLNIYPL